MAATQQYNCKWCKGPFTARVADRNRGWALYCCKSCKAMRQEKNTGQYAALVEAANEHYGHDDIDWEGPGWDAHKDIF